jgi:hypothetical protein
VSDTVHTRQNRGKYKLLACVPCENCRATLYPDSAEARALPRAPGLDRLHASPRVLLLPCSLLPGGPAMSALPNVSSEAATAISTHFYPNRSIVVGRATLSGDPKYRGPGVPVRVLERLGSTRPGATLRVLVEATEFPGFAWLNSSDLETRS